MRKRDALRAALCFGAALFLPGSGQGAPDSDRLVLPPERRELASPSGRFVLVIASDDHWKTRQATVMLLEQTANGRQPLWGQKLPQELGPRRGWVTDTGTVLLVDEWINVPSRHALLVISPGGKLLAHKTIDELIELLGVSRRTVADHGKLGIWLSGEPRLSGDQKAMVFPAAGRALWVSVSDGHIQAKPPAPN